MPNIKSAVKRVKTSEKSRQRNITTKSEVKTLRKSLLAAVADPGRPQDPGSLSRLLLRPRQGRQARHHSQKHGHPEESPRRRPAAQTPPPSNPAPIPDSAIPRPARFPARGAFYGVVHLSGPIRTGGSSLMSPRHRSRRRPAISTCSRWRS